jgi:hypothetical protein
MDSSELQELLFLEDYLNRLLRRLQRRIIASGGTIPEDGNLCGLSKAEAVEEIEAETRESEKPTAGASDEVNWLEQNFGMEKLNDNLGISSRRYLYNQRLRTKNAPPSEE